MRNHKMTVRAKFQVTSKSEPRVINAWIYEDNKAGSREVVDIQLMPVVGGSEENNKFYASTPSGNVMLSTVNLEAAKQFEVGKQYYVDFTEAE